MATLVIAGKLIQEESICKESFSKGKRNARTQGWATRNPVCYEGSWSSKRHNGCIRRIEYTRLFFV